MLNDTLPNQIDIRKLVVKGATITATVPVSSLPRFVDLLANNLGTVKVELQFYLDDQRIRRVDGHLVANVSVVCERCLEPMAICIESSFKQGIVWSEDDAKRLSSDIEPLIVGEELVDLSDIVSEELLLSLPYVNYHKPEECNKPVGYVCEDSDHKFIDESDTVKKEDGRKNPFKILEQLKTDNKH